MCPRRSRKSRKGRGRRTGHAHERRAVGDGRGGHGLRLLGLERRHARYLMKEPTASGRVLALESLSIPSPDDNSIMPSGLEGIITQKLDALSLNATTFAKLASAFGPVFHKEALRTCFPGPKDSGNDDAIDELVKAQLIVADSHGTDTQNTRAAQRLAWSQRIAEERGDLGGSVYGGGRARTTGTTSAVWLATIYDLSPEIACRVAGPWSVGIVAMSVARKRDYGAIPPNPWTTRTCWRSFGPLKGLKG